MAKVSRIVMLWLLPIAALAQQGGSINERLSRLEEGQKAIHQRIDVLRTDINKRFNWLYMLRGAVIVLNGAMVGSVVWLAHKERPIGHFEYQKLQEERLRAAERRLQQLQEVKREKFFFLRFVERRASSATPAGVGRREDKIDPQGVPTIL